MSFSLPQELQNVLSSGPSQRFVVMTCGIAGSGKSRLAKTLCSTYPNFQRLSIDSYIFTRYGLAGIDCSAAQYAQYQAEAREVLRSQFRHIINQGLTDVVLDFSFWNRGYRDEWRDIIRDERGIVGKNADGEDKEKVRLLLVFFDAEEEVLWRRIEERRENAERKGRGADDAVVLTRELLSFYCKGFERPGEEEGAIVIKVE